MKSDYIVGGILVGAMGRKVSKQEAVQMGLLTPDEQPFPASEAGMGRAHQRAS